MATADNKFEECSATIDRVAVRLPPFWPEDPDIWFAQVEAQFETSGTKIDSTKFYTVVQQLDQRIAREVRDVITNPPATGKYDKLKNELIKRLSTSRDHRMRQLLTHEELGDRKPTQFLRHLRSLAGDQVNDDFLRSLWASRLPTHIQAIIASQTSLRLDEVAELADKIIEVTPFSNQVSSASTPGFDELFKKMEDFISTRIRTELNHQVAQMNLGRGRANYPHRQSGSQRSGSRHRRRSASRNRDPDISVCSTA
ncbi:uncharacterized protein LOC135194113 [Vanessa tameamea]|uniref:Uncharacterized protein LOC135194113 n=1 Tax=Vanessa tameamea TaxID=334116 RepID=A0ABM4AU95_VANTA